MAGSVFLSEDFLLESEPARRLYHDFAARLPIVDFHTHIVPAQIAEDRQFRNLTELWLDEDRGKWRLMRAHGVEERYCSGDASDYEKFVRWAETLPRLVRSPLYDWARLELKRAFGIDDRLLGPDTAGEIWEACNARLAEPSFSAREVLRRGNVALVCTTDDPLDTLEPHRAVAADPTCPVRMLPTWRPDRALAAEDPQGFNAWVDGLGALVGTDVRDYAAFLGALAQRHGAFHAAGCRMSDRGVERAWAEDFTLRQVTEAFAKLRAGRALEPGECAAFKSAVLYELALLDQARGWTQQLHLGAIRDCNTRLGRALGTDMGFDVVGDFDQAAALVRFLDRLDRADRLPRTILYNLNPRDTALLASVLGSFPDHRIPGKLQLGSAWWYNDHTDGILAHLDALSQAGLLSRFVGMVTDSRSLLSYTRHEYFRRVLCNVLGGDVARGHLPTDFDLIGALVQDVCYRNALAYLGLDTAETPTRFVPHGASDKVTG